MKGILYRALEKDEILNMIYLDSKGHLSQRRIRILSINENQFRAFCFSKNQQRTFKFENILSIGQDSLVNKGA
jgi:predicted DNA-binding transcriptional regulator YafY